MPLLSNFIFRIHYIQTCVGLWELNFPGRVQQLLEGIDDLLSLPHPQPPTILSFKDYKYEVSGGLRISVQALEVPFSGT